MGLFRRASTLLHVTGSAGCDDVFPRGFTAQTSGDDMVEGEVFAAATIFALKMITQKDVEAGEGGELALFHILSQRDNAGNFHVEAGRVHFAIVACHDVHSI